MTTTTRTRTRTRSERPWTHAGKLASAGLLFCLGLPGCSGPARAAEKPAIPVKVQSAAKAPSSGVTRYSGALEPASRVDMAFRVNGYVEALGEVAGANGKRALDKGDFVKKGTLLARVRVADYAQKALLAVAQVGEARASARLASEELARSERLFAARAITQAELDSAVARADSARAQVDGALARSSEAGLSLGDTVLRAPMDGVILSRQVEVGTLVSPGQPALTIADTRSVKAVFGAPQSLVEKLSVGSAVQVFVGSEGEAKAPEKLLDARINRIAPAADQNGRVFSVEAALPNPAGELRPGSVVSVRVPDALLGDDRLLVPLGAIVRSPNDARGFAVFVLDGAAHRAPARLRAVDLGEVVGNAVTVRNGLTAGERVVTVGATLLHDGSDAIVIR